MRYVGSVINGSALLASLWFVKVYKTVDAGLLMQLDQLAPGFLASIKIAIGLLAAACVITELWKWMMRGSSDNMQLTLSQRKNVLLLKERRVAELEAATSDLAKKLRIREIELDCRGPW